MLAHLPTSELKVFPLFEIPERSAIKGASLWTIMEVLLYYQVFQYFCGRILISNSMLNTKISFFNRLSSSRTR